MKNGKRILWMVLCLAVILAVSGPADAASAGKDKTAIKNRINTYIKAVKAYDTDTVKKCFQPAKADSIGVQPEMASTIRKMHKDHLKASVTKVTVSGGKATVKLKVSYYKGYDLFTKSILKTMGRATEQWTIRKLAKEVAADAYKRYQNQKNKARYVITKTLTVPMIRKNGKWLIEKNTEYMQRLLDCAYEYAIDQAD